MVYILPILHTRDYLDGHQTFSHRVFTLVSDKLKRKWLWVVYLLIPKDNQHKLLPWLQETVAVRSLFEVNCISNLKPYHTLQLTTLRTSVSESLQLHYKIWCFCGDSVADVQWLLIIACSLWYMQVWPFSKLHDQWRLWEASTLVVSCN